MMQPNPRYDNHNAGISQKLGIVFNPVFTDALANVLLLKH